MKSNSICTACSLSLPSNLTIVFIVLKLTDIINWSWLWVLSPIWITMLLIIAIVVFMVSVIDRDYKNGTIN